ncbi:hypothetical protein BDQ17DRAFT_1326834 [Cyathus striatus]|nr:hypothetical protein BDQ17DRAFT_1326834 [Cyathus striatus]
MSTSSSTEANYPIMKAQVCRGRDAGDLVKSDSDGVGLTRLKKEDNVLEDDGDALEDSPFHAEAGLPTTAGRKESAGSDLADAGRTRPKKDENAPEGDEDALENGGRAVGCGGGALEVSPPHVEAGVRPTAAGGEELARSDLADVGLMRLRKDENVLEGDEDALEGGGGALEVSPPHIEAGVPTAAGGEDLEGSDLADVSLMRLKKDGNVLEGGEDALEASPLHIEAGVPTAAGGEDLVGSDLADMGLMRLKKDESVLGGNGDALESGGRAEGYGGGALETSPPHVEAGVARGRKNIGQQTANVQDTSSDLVWTPQSQSNVESTVAAGDRPIDDEINENVTPTSKGKRHRLTIILGFLAVVADLVGSMHGLVREKNPDVAYIMAGFGVTAAIIALVAAGKHMRCMVYELFLMLRMHELLLRISHKSAYEETQMGRGLCLGEGLSPIRMFPSNRSGRRQNTAVAAGPSRTYSSQSVPASVVNPTFPDLLLLTITIVLRIRLPPTTRIQRRVRGYSSHPEEEQWRGHGSNSELYNLPPLCRKGELKNLKYMTMQMCKRLGSFALELVW